MVFLIFRNIFISNQLASVNQQKLYLLLLISDVFRKKFVLFFYSFLRIHPNVMNWLLIIFRYWDLLSNFKSTIYNYVHEISFKIFMI